MPRPRIGQRRRWNHNRQILWFLSAPRLRQAWTDKRSDEHTPRPGGGGEPHGALRGQDPTEGGDAGRDRGAAPTATRPGSDCFQQALGGYKVPEGWTRRVAAGIAFLSFVWANYCVFVFSQIWEIIKVTVAVYCFLGITILISSESILWERKREREFVLFPDSRAILTSIIVTLINCLFE